MLRDIAFRSRCSSTISCRSSAPPTWPTCRTSGWSASACIPVVIETLAARPQLQERLTEEIADTLESGLDLKGVLVVLDVQHRCVTTRGSRQERSSTITIASRGALAEPAARTEIIALIGAAERG